MAKLACAKCGGKVKMATGGAMPKVLAKAKTQLYGIPQENMGTSSQYGFGKKGGTVKKMTEGGPTDPNKYVMNKTNVFGKRKHKEISKDKFDRLSNRYTKQEGSESLGTNTSMVQQVISGRNPKKSVSRFDEVKEAELKKKLPPMKTGGTTKATKFAALAPPYNKATFADRIARAKKKK